MSDADEIVKYQIALAKQVISLTADDSLPLEFQLSIYDQINHDMRMNKINNNNSNTRFATSKQKKLLDDLDIEYKQDIDVKTASRLIGEALRKG
jgi:putative lipase involved disintegration of autophagic bodies